ncbi:MAG TPA: hypothetical protein VJL59_03295 [Anaerolineales bacterium]|nr:hypothetical protein [Anaerolineales bacterium]
MPHDRDNATLIDIARAARLVLAFKSNVAKDAFIDKRPARLMQAGRF